MGQVVRRRHREVGRSKLWFWLNCRLWLWWVDCRYRWGVLLEPRFGPGEVMSSVLIAPNRPPAPLPAERRSREASRPGVALSSRLSLPAVGVAALAAVLVGIGWSHHWGGERFTGSLTSLRVVLVGPLTLGIIGIFLIVERVWPAQQRPLLARGYRHDLLLTVMNAALVAPLVTALTLSFVEVVRSGLPW